MLLAALLAIATIALARVGGGESYSGGSSSSSSGSSSGSGDYSSGSSSGSSSSGGGSPAPLGAAGCFLMLFFLLLMIVFFAIAISIGSPGVTTMVRTPPSARGGPLEALRAFDPNFSRIVFDDFCYSLYTRVHEARGRGELLRYAPYLAADVRRQLLARNPANLTEVKGIVIGGFQVAVVTPGARRPVARGRKV